MSNILILVLASDTYPSKEMRNIKQTWVKERNDNIKVFFYEREIKTTE